LHLAESQRLSAHQGGGATPVDPSRFRRKESKIEMQNAMKKIFILLAFLTASISAQIPTATHIAILKAEDARRYDKTLEDLLKSSNVAVRNRAALAAGRIGDERAIPALEDVLRNTKSEAVWAMAAFAIGEIESVKGAGVILDVFKAENGFSGRSSQLLSRAVEAAGKIAGANQNDPKSKELGDWIIIVLNTEHSRGKPPLKDVIRLGLTAIIRARPATPEETVRKFLGYADPEIVSDALNTLARLRAKNANRDARDLLATHADAIVRANAARVLGAADDKEAVDVLIKAATADSDPRVRVSAIRALAAIRVAKSADQLLARGEALLDAYKKNFKPNFVPVEQNEFIEISNALGQVLAKTGNARAIALFRDFAKIDQFRTTEPYIARVKIGGIRPGAGLGDDAPVPTTYRQYSTLVQVIGEFAAYEPESEEGKKIKDEAPEQVRKLLQAFLADDPKLEPEAIMAAPDALRAFARFKTDDLGEILRSALLNGDVQIRATAAELISELPSSQENLDELIFSFDIAFRRDTTSNDASIATLEALFKLDKQKALSRIAVAIGMLDQVVRMRARKMLDDEAYNGVERATELLRYFNENRYDRVSRFTRKGTLPGKVEISKLGLLWNTDADYRRAALRKNGTVSAIFTTAKGTFTIDLLPEDAPLTVDNIIKLARSGYFNGLEVHRVVPNFVMQDGDPRGDGNGGPGWSIRCEVNMVPYERGAVGMALSGKDTGGSQWFVTHSPQPHLDGGYTVFGKVNETGMKVVDNIVRGDKILTVRIIGR